MGSLILCHKKKAEHPYEITQIHRRIYTIEELNYYLCHHLYLVDHTIMNTQLCDWLRDELALQELAESLRRLLEQDGPIEQFVMTILTFSAICTTEELTAIRETLDALKSKRPVEKKKCKADNLLLGGSIRPAILAYQDILCGERDETAGREFYGRVYASLGAAYGRLFLYEEAARMYEAAYEICADTSMARAYLYARRKSMEETAYEAMLGSHPEYRELDEEITRELAATATADAACPRRESGFNLEGNEADSGQNEGHGGDNECNEREPGLPDEEDDERVCGDGILTRGDILENWKEEYRRVSL